MQSLNCPLQKFDKQGEKTGWTYILIPEAVASTLNPSDKKSFRIKGSIDNVTIKQLALLPVGDGDYILPVNAGIRKAIRKKATDVVILKIEADHSEFVLSADMLSCLEEDLSALKHFESLAGSHQKYFSKWIESAKTMNTKADRIAKTLFAMKNKMDYGAMIRHFSGKKTR